MLATLLCELMKFDNMEKLKGSAFVGHADCGGLHELGSQTEFRPIPLATQFKLSTRGWARAEIQYTRTPTVEPL